MDCRSRSLNPVADPNRASSGRPDRTDYLHVFCPAFALATIGATLTVRCAGRSAVPAAVRIVPACARRPAEDSHLQHASHAWQTKARLEALHSAAGRSIRTPRTNERGCTICRS